LIFFRAVQGLGAGGVLPLAFTIVGELFDLEQRARMQGLFSAVWGVSAVIGPLIGGFLVDQVSWHWVFLINLIPGLLAMGFVWFAWNGGERQTTSKVTIDYSGAALLTLATLSLLLGLSELGTPLGWGFLAAAVLLFALLFVAERRAVDPILPLPLFRDRLFNVSILHGMFSGIAMFGSLAYVPLFAQAVLGTSATEAGITLTPMSLFWTLASIFGGRLLLKMGYRTLSLFGMVLLVAGSLLMSTIGANASQILIMVYTGMMGIGMGLSIPAFLIAVQSTVRKEELGVATSTVQFSRSIGGTLGVSILGAFLSPRLAGLLVTQGIDPNSVSLNSLIDPVASASATLEGPLRIALGIAIANMFIIAFVAALGALLSVMFAPGGKIAQLVAERAGKQGVEPVMERPPEM
jgi:MFS family permease